MRILFVVDDLHWVQASRHAQLAQRIPEIDLRRLSLRSFALARRLRRYRSTPIYLGSWRLIESLERAHGLRLSGDELARTMVSVTSHYGIGGGLAPEKALRAGDQPLETFARAVTTLRACAVVTVNSTPLYELLAPHLPALIYAPNGVDERLFHPPRERHYDPERPRVGWAGKVKAAKNIEALHAARELLEREGFVFELVGGAKTEAPQLDAAGMCAFYQRLDWYLCTSWHEGTPNPALEAAACGVPLITTRVGNMVDLVVDGENGFFVEPSAESVVGRLRALQGLEPNEHERLSNRIRAAIEAHWTWDRNAARYREAFARLLAVAA